MQRLAVQRTVMIRSSAVAKPTSESWPPTKANFLPPGRRSRRCPPGIVFDGYTVTQAHDGRHFCH